MKTSKGRSGPKCPRGGTTIALYPENKAEEWETEEDPSNENNPPIVAGNNIKKTRDSFTMSLVEVPVITGGSDRASVDVPASSSPSISPHEAGVSGEVVAIQRDEVTSFTWHFFSLRIWK